MAIIVTKDIQVKILSIIFLILLLGFISSKHLNLHSKTLSLGGSESQAWSQPNNISQQYPTLISRDNWSLSFTQIEGIIKSIKSDSNRNLIINADLTEKLPQVLFYLNNDPESMQWQRLEFLLSKSLGHKVGTTFYGLVHHYYYYKKEAIEYSNKIKLAQYANKKALLEDHVSVLERLQARHFTKQIAVKLFNKKNKTTHYLNSIRIINMDKTLNNNEKKERLSILSKDYKHSLSQR